MSDFVDGSKVKDALDEMDSMVTVGRFMSSTEAQMARGALESAGIETYVQGANASGLYPGTLSTRVLVRKEDEAAANELLASINAGVTGPEGDDAE